jgi:hypothetical protein
MQVPGRGDDREFGLEDKLKEAFGLLRSFAATHMSTHSLSSSQLSPVAAKAEARACFEEAHQNILHYATIAQQVTCRGMSWLPLIARTCGLNEATPSNPCRRWAPS